MKQAFYSLNRYLNLTAAERPLHRWKKKEMMPRVNEQDATNPYAVMLAKTLNRA